MDPASPHSNRIFYLRVLRRVTYIFCCCGDHSISSMPRRYPSPRSSLHASRQPCKARLPSQPASVLSIVFIDCCPTALCEPTIEFCIHALISNVLVSQHLGLGPSTDVFLMFIAVQLPRVLGLYSSGSFVQHRCLLSMHHSARESRSLCDTPIGSFAVPHMVLPLCLLF